MKKVQKQICNQIKEIKMTIQKSSIKVSSLLLICILRFFSLFSLQTLCLRHIDGKLSQ